MPPTSQTDAADPTARFLQSMASPDPVVRGAAATFARRRGAPAVAGLGELAVSQDKAVAKAARKALQDITHYAARPGGFVEAAAVAQQLLILASSSSRPREVRAHALYLLGFVAGDPAVPALATLLTDTEVGADARMTMERINTKASRGALAKAQPRPNP